jgi:hypothetical protein
MKLTEFSVSIDIVVSKTIYVDAENEEQAKQLAIKKVRDEPFYYARTADAYVGAKVIDVY